eukprot:TRINITY_DN2070_c0_g1_i1.p1 TRINITY_DN2070_c0_g1~~TRINITY_DN2070_c0_g1_i1.p1  ORF type:complete len:314 (-),score=56.78 TRINITY_DN2070_c0_g1_i1:225-1031(-)
MFAFRNSVHWTDAHNIVRRTQILEFDIQKSKDGHLVIMHDENVGTTTDGTGRVADLTLDEIRSLDAAYKFTPDGGETFPYRGKGHQVPTLEEVLKEFTPITPLIFYFDFKDANAIQDALEMAKRYGVTERLICGAVPPAANKELMRLKPAHVPATPDKTSMIIMVFLHAARLLWLYPMRHEIVGVTPYRWGLRILTAHFSEDFHFRKRVIATFGDYLDTEEGQLDCIINGADILMTDRPDILHGSIEKGRFYFPRINNNDVISNNNIN